MKNINGLFVNKVVHNFNYITAAVKTGHKALVVLSFNETVKQWKLKNRANIGFRNAMFECGSIENIVDEHSLIIMLRGRIITHCETYGRTGLFAS